MSPGIEVYEHLLTGYKPLVYSHDWMVALLNFEEIMLAQKAIEIERHKLTDEVFILMKGRAAFYLVIEDQPLEVIELDPGKIYNVTKGTWHNLLATPEAVFCIVENRDTDITDTHIRALTAAERQQMFTQLPAWLK